MTFNKSTASKMFHSYTGFTLAEVLITITIIGVVAAIVIPALVKNITEHVWGEEKTNFEMKINEAMNQMKTNDVLTGYATSEDFVNAFVKYMKITRTCDSSNLTNCFVPKFKTTTGKEIITATTMKTGKNFGKKTYTSPLVGIQFNNGIQGLISYNPDCAYVNPYDNRASATECLSMLYDLNGSSKPNVVGKDIVAYKVDKIGEACVFELNGTCYGSYYSTITPMTYAQCMAEKGQLGLSTCCTQAYCTSNGDYFAGAAKACGGKNNLPTVAQLEDLAKALYPTGTMDMYRKITAPRDDAKALEMGLPTGYQFWLWSSENDTDGYYSGACRMFIQNSTDDIWALRGSSDFKALCLIKD